jgi:hypothetical protein
LEHVVRHHVTRAVGAALVASALLTSALTGTSPAAAVAAPAPAPVEYSTDGTNWSPFPAAIFDPAWRPTPGSRQSATLHIRSNRAEPTTVGLYSGTATSDSIEVLRAASLRSSTTVLTLADTATCTLLAPQSVLHRGQSIGIPLAIALDPELTTGMGTTFSFQLQLALSDTGPVTLANGCPVDPIIISAFPAAQSSGTSPSLSGTGSEPPAWAFAGAVALLVTGTAALALARRRRDPA